MKIRKRSNHSHFSMNPQTKLAGGGVPVSMNPQTKWGRSCLHLPSPGIKGMILPSAGVKGLSLSRARVKDSVALLDWFNLT